RGRVPPLRSSALSLPSLFVHDPSTCEIYTLSLHDALPILATNGKLQIFNAIGFGFKRTFSNAKLWLLGSVAFIAFTMVLGAIAGDRKSTRLNSSHVSNSYAVFCWKKKNLIMPDR